MHYEYKTENTCSQSISFDINDNVITNISFYGGCNGNLKALGALVEGQEIDTIISKLKGIKCNYKNTSCGDQLAQALIKIKEDKND